MEKECSDEGSDAVGEQVEPVAGATWNEVFLHQFGESAIGNADDDGKQDGSFLVAYPVGNELFAIAPKASEGESGIHADVGHLVEPNGWLDAWENRTRKSGEDQDDDSTQDSRVAISCQLFQEINRSWLRRRRHP